MPNELYVIIDWQNEEDITTIPNTTFETYSDALRYLIELSMKTHNIYLQIVEID